MPFNAVLTTVYMYPHQAILFELLEGIVNLVRVCRHIREGTRAWRKGAWLVPVGALKADLA